MFKAEIVEVACGVQLERSVREDAYTGSIASLLAAGLVQPHQLPGEPGNGRVMVSFHPDGRRVRQGNTTACRELGFTQVCRVGVGKLRVVRGIGVVEEAARHEAHFVLRAAEAKAARAWPFPLVLGAPP
jgi:hypothetical protein